MTGQRKNRVAERGNLIVIGAMCLLWGVPMFRFWGAVFGPFRPFDYPQGNVTPSLAWLLAGIAVCALPCLLPQAYYGCWERIRGRRLYESLGVRAFKRYTTNGDLINRGARRVDAGYRLVRGRGSAEVWAQGTRAGERSHMVLLIAGLVTAAYAMHIGWYAWAVGLTVSNVVFNFYPVLLQRYNRCRIESLLLHGEVGGRAQEPPTGRPGQRSP